MSKGVTILPRDSRAQEAKALLDEDSARDRLLTTIAQVTGRSAGVGGNPAVSRNLK